MRLVEDVAGLTEDRAELEYRRILADFKDRHWQTELIFQERWAEVEEMLSLQGRGFSSIRQKLIGAYFCHEYTYAAAALMNPSIVPHPDQSGCQDGSIRFVMSLRAVGEGHISSIVFREGIAHTDGTFQLWPQTAFATSAEVDEATLVDEDDSVTVRRHRETSLSNSVIFPITEQQRGGLEDLRMVRFRNEDGSFDWYGTYTAYSGSSIRSEMLQTRDFRSFDLRPLEGRAARNKGMALFPEAIDGQYAMVGRQDGKNLFLLKSDDINCWDAEGTFLLGPEYPWEFIQIGNCGSPIRTDEGWLLLTHGVGAMRKYALGAVLLDLKDPSKVLARTVEPLLTAEDADRSGYVPNVVYTCGALAVGDRMLLPYGISDSSVGFATIAFEKLFARMA